MHVRVTRGSSDPAKADRIRAIQDDIVAAMKRLPGFVGYQGGLDPTTGNLVAISTWESDEAARFGRAELGEVFQRVQELAQLEPAEVYELVTSS
ncbi:MAG TPA: hypothetical protein VD813_08100 [Pseudonocardia sp.]|nr:hypothetical protein [Pseudonocardia sp.]